MLGLFKNVFSKKKEKEYVPDPPGRTFKRILTGRCFGCENVNANEDNIAKAKWGKIDQIQELKLLPMFLKYTYEDNKEEGDDKKISSVHVAFQKEVLDQKWNMLHITEISFTIDPSEFDEFEKMSGVNLNKDFRDLTPKSDAAVYQGEERRKERRAI
ncbi:MAG: hypothetical protein COB07_08525 [Sulfurovum sp.]|nr:MAG: hypothetical protein COB07_08525 [Sulfurovum sp.]